MKNSRFVATLLAVVFCSGFSAASQAKYPERPITVIVPFSPGGGTDILTRAIQKYFPYDLVPINIEGASGLVGAQQTLYAKPDGYTILGHNPMNLLGQYMAGTTDKTLYKDLKTICYIVDDYTIVTTNKSTGWKTWDDVVKAAKAKPGSIKWGVTGAAGQSVADTTRAMKAFGLDVVLVPYDGGAATRTALLGSHIQLETSTGSDIRKVVESGDVIPLAAIASTRSPFLPKVPTFRELGADVASGAPRGYYAPPGISKENLATLTEACRKVSQNPEFQAFTKTLGYDVKFVGPAEADKWIDEQHKIFKPLFDSFKGKK
jgi:tripartite-type tricarboxylate transporter receptor subunit TctC